jgi:two-component system phosphate regulon sensor histidine kinase PhoR
MTESGGMSDTEKLHEVQAELADLRRRLADLEFARQQLEARVAAAPPAAPAAMPVIAGNDDLAGTLHAFVRRVTGILRAEKCVILLYDPSSGELVAQRPAHNISDEDVITFHVPISKGISGEVFREGHPIICNECADDPRCQEEGVARFGVAASLTVPMIVERRDEHQQLIERTTIGVVHVFNKRYGAKFTEEDVQLLSVLARNATAILSIARPVVSMSQEMKQLTYTLQSMASGLLVISPDQRVQLVNAAAIQYLRLAGSNLIGQPYTDVISEDDFRAFLGEAIRQGGDLAHEFSVGDRIYQAQTAAVRDDHGTVTGVMCVLHDVTELRNLERMKTDFVSTVSHELRTPLTSIKGFIRTLLDDPAGEYYDQATRMEFYGIIDEECDRLTRLISDLLNVSRIERGMPLQMMYGTVDVVACVERAVAFQRSYAADHTLTIDIPEPLPTITADRDKIDQILTNLLGNAVKYSPNGGTITTRVVVEGDRICFSVSDQGMGIPTDQLDKIFERFHRVNSGDTQRVGGTGLGLFLVKSLVEAHQGVIWVDSILGKGSTFHFTVPIAPVGVEATPAK